MDMNNNDILIRLRYALDIKDTEMVKIFQLGGIEVTAEEVKNILTKTKDSYDDEFGSVDDMNHDNIPCDNFMLESFLNGLIIYKRGKQEPKPGNTESQPMMIKNNDSVNNVLLKKLKIALTLTSEDMIDILKEAGVVISKGELSALLRKEGHSNYRKCGDRFARNFLKGLGMRHRG
ncbi:DUF1456 family protein [Oceanobacillus sp. 143]|uniref:DUF1456 domain-containing protein n=1 Tax=Oceanobacillus zhaokaii TaxID=2052660 RepID=A0A345PCM4_9BACI|nr:DUF1456 family protein [Oceanobacillus zhaokaii]AXI07754.1 DUF1456 domain-containing protein [Oceanobacillus zhaokaii]QGS67900.1 DUF1456 family protein [Oceanobacillus sp. 143]